MRQKQTDATPEVKDDRGILLNREHSIKDLAQRLTSPVSPTTEEKPLRVSDMAGIVSKAKEELAKSQSKGYIFLFYFSVMFHLLVVYIMFNKSNFK